MFLLVWCELDYIRLQTTFTCLLTGGSVKPSRVKLILIDCLSANFRPGRERVSNRTMMAKVDYSDYIILALLAVATLAYFSKGKLWYKDAKVTPSSYAVPKAVQSRDIVQRMQDSVSRCCDA